MALGRNFTEALQKALRSTEKRGAQFTLGRGPGRPGGPAAPGRAAHRRAHRPGHAGHPRRRHPGGAVRVHQDRPVVPRPAVPARRDRRRGPRERRAHPGAAAPRQAARVLRRPDRRAAPPARGRRPRRPARAGDPPGLQDRRHLRGRVRRQHAVPLLLLRRGGRDPPPREAGDRHPRLRARTASGRAWSSTTPASTPASRCATPATRPSWSTATPRRSPPTTTPPTGCTSSRSPSRTSSRSCTPRPAAARWPGVIVQLGGQTPLGLAAKLEEAGVPIIGTSPQAIDLAEERGAFGQVLERAGLRRAQARDGVELPRGQGDRRRDRLPRPGPPQLRARRARDADRLRRGLPRGVHADRDRGLPGAPRARRPLPRRRHRDRRRRAVRRRGDVPRRDHGAHRGGRHPLRRLRVRHPARPPWATPSSPGSAPPPRPSPAGSGCGVC